MNLKRFLPGARANAAPVLADVTDAKFRVGQSWNYQTRPHDVGSTFTIVKVEASEKLGTIVHISLRGLKLKNPHHPNQWSDTVSHMPFSLAAVERSVTDLAEENVALPDFQEGYDQWRLAFDAGRGGVFTLAVAEAVEGMEEAMNSDA